MFTLKVLSKEVTEKVLTLPEVIRVVETVYTNKAEGGVTVFPMVEHVWEPGVADMDIRSGYMKAGEIFGLKLVSWFGNNAGTEIPPLVGTVLVADATTGAPIGIADGSYITGLRTGAAGALGAKALARKNSKTLLMVGAGHVAQFQVAATLSLFPAIEKVLVYDGLSYENEVAFAERMPEFLRKYKVESKAAFVPVKDIATETREADIIITATPSREPVIKKEWVAPGTHFSCIGADMQGKEEIDPEIFVNARVFTDDTRQCINVGEIEIPVKKGILKPEDIAGEIGEVLSGKKTGRENEEQITVYDATGIALLDLAVAKLAMDLAEEQGLGNRVEL